MSKLATVVQAQEPALLKLPPYEQVAGQESVLPPGFPQEVGLARSSIRER